MTLQKLLVNLKDFSEGETNQSWRKDTVIHYENEYINVIRIDSSNKAGGTNVKSGKQWSIIITLKKDFTILPNWNVLEKFIDIRVTNVTHGVNKGEYGIRLYGMTSDPSNAIIYDLLDYIFSCTRLAMNPLFDV